MHYNNLKFFYLLKLKKYDLFKIILNIRLKFLLHLHSTHTHTEYFIITCISVFSFMPRLPKNEPTKYLLKKTGLGHQSGCDETEEKTLPLLMINMRPFSKN
jgi:hypothetical protein